jgi:hypothetical protein
MEPLDLTVQPPRNPYKKMEGLYMLPRTIDKLRAKLPGGKVGAYTVLGSSPLLPGLSLVLLDGIGITDECLLNVVQRASVEEEIANWLRENVDLRNVAAVFAAVSKGKEVKEQKEKGRPHREASATTIQRNP